MYLAAADRSWGVGWRLESGSDAVLGARECSRAALWLPVFIACCAGRAALTEVAVAVALVADALLLRFLVAVVVSLRVVVAAAPLLLVVGCAVVVLVVAVVVACVSVASASPSCRFPWPVPSSLALLPS